MDGISKAAINITLDGINVQDNNGKSGDGFYTYVRPRLDAVQEVTVSTGTAGADNTARARYRSSSSRARAATSITAACIEYHRNPSLNANYWFNNRDVAPDPRRAKPRARASC